ncbi:murein hydrolase activator EnvC family protein [Caenispirillum salinarum]|uniref:murein hydrolase activator EnvC family protein n=1 Tax=Caenispirillum salinarum TaxID=859058 RepID=UPI00384CFF6F
MPLLPRLTRPALGVALAALMLFGGGGGWSVPAARAAQDGPLLPPPPDTDETRTHEELEQIRRKLEESRAQEKTLSRKAQSLNVEVRSLRDRLVAAAAKVQDYEESLSYLETRLRDLQREETALRDGLAERREQMAKVLTALQRLSWRPKETLLMQPAPAEDTVRSALLLRSAVPALAREAEALRADLVALEEVETAIAAQRDEIAGLGAEFEAEHARLQTLVGEKARLMENTSQRSEQAARQARDLAEEAESMKEFLATLAEERRKREAELARQRELALARQLAALAGPKPATPDERRVAMPAAKPQPPQTPRTAAASGGVVPPPPRPAAPASPPAQTASRPAAADIKPVALRPLESMRGAMPLPARGRIITSFGDELTPGNSSRGMVVETRAGATVVAPADGVVAFSGPFRGYGHLLILEHADGYHTLLSGMARIDAQVGQRLLAGEPVGLMDGAETPSLYVELRRDGQPINPMPWLTANKGKISG